MTDWFGARYPISENPLQKFHNQRPEAIFIYKIKIKNPILLINVAHLN